VLASLKSRAEPSDVADKEAPVHRCFRYMSNRPEQFFYKDAIEKGLRLDQEKLKARITMLCNTASNSLEPGGKPRMLIICWPCN